MLMVPRDLKANRAQLAHRVRKVCKAHRGSKA